MRLLLLLTLPRDRRPRRDVRAILESPAWQVRYRERGNDRRAQVSSQHSTPELGIYPFLRKLEPLGELRHRQTTEDYRPAGSLSHLHAMANADAPNRAGQ